MSSLCQTWLITGGAGVPGLVVPSDLRSFLPFFVAGVRSFDSDLQCRRAFCPVYTSQSLWRLNPQGLNHTHAHTQVHTCASTSTQLIHTQMDTRAQCIHAHTCLRMRSHTYTHIGRCIYSHTYTYMHSQCVCTRAYTQRQVHTYIDTCTYMHTHRHVHIH